jgi:serine/threonine-protein kinase
MTAKGFGVSARGERKNVGVPVARADAGALSAPFRGVSGQPIERADTRPVASLSPVAPANRPAARPRVGELRPGLDFVLGETLRRDPLGVTYRARDEGGGDDVAVTLYHAAAVPTPAAVDRFQDAIQMAAFDHPAILSVDRVGRWRAQVAVTRRLVYAPTLGEAFPRGMRCEFPRAVEVLRPIAEALDAAHGRGIIHGDLRPEAILLTRSAGPLLVGCGVADGLDLSALLIATLERRTEWGWGWLEAAAPYVAPERWRGVAADARSDQYALAVIAFRLLTGELPFAAEHAAQLAELHHIAVIPRPSTRRADLPPAADVAITRALAKVAGERFTTATGFIEALNGRPSRPQVVTNPVSVSGPDVPPAEARPWRRVVAVGLVVVGALVLAGLVALARR